MRWSFIIVLALTTFVPVAAPAQTRQLAKTTETYDVFGAIPPADFATTECVVENFVGVTRPVQFAGTEPPHEPNPFQIPYCPWKNGSSSDYSMVIGTMSTASLRDLGTYTILCRDRTVSRQVEPCWEVDGVCGHTIVCLAADTFNHGDTTFTIEVYNNPPALSVGHGGSGLIEDNDVEHDAAVTLSAAASDLDGGAVDVSWVVTSRPAGATGVVGSLIGSTLDLQFTGEADFGRWEIDVRADDAQGERVTTRYTIDVVNKTPVPEISGPARVRVGDPIELSVSPDEDGGSYASVRWERRRDGSGTWVDIGSSTTLTLPTPASELDVWHFRVTVTDNESPPLTGTSVEHTLEVYNDPPMVTVAPPVTPVPAIGGTIALGASATDPDGGSVQLSWRAIQAPASAGVPVGTTLSTTGSLSIPTTAAHAGTWVFRATAIDDEAGSTESHPVVVLVDAVPEVHIRDEPYVIVGPEVFYLTDESVDPDSHCDDPSDPHQCHLVESGESFTPISSGISHWLWSVESVPSEYSGIYFPDRVSVTFSGVPDSLRSIPFLEGSIHHGTYRFRVDVEDGEGNERSGTITVLVRPPPVPPIAHVGLPQQYVTDAARALTEDVIVDGSLSFDPDTALSFTPAPGEGITAWSWVALPPPGCSMSPAMLPAPTSVMLPAGTIIPVECFGVWTARLTVADDDSPVEYGFADAIVVLRSCASDVCIDMPTMARPALVDPSLPVDVSIIYYVDTLVYLWPDYQYGFYAFIDILPTGSSTPIMTLVDTTVSYRPGELTTVHWSGETSGGGMAPSGTYDVRVRLTDTSGAPGPEVREDLAILYEDVDIDIDATTSDRYVRLQDLEEGTDMAELAYVITGAFGIDQVRALISRDSGAVAHDSVIATTAMTGVIGWDGRDPSGVLLPPGDYELKVSAYRDGRRLAESDPRSFTIYRIGLGPTPSAIISVGRNTDDDDGNGTPDRDDSRVTGEDDLAELAIRIEPYMPGEIRVEVVGGGTPVSLYTLPDKFMPLGPPASYSLVAGFAVPRFWIEGNSIGLHELELTFTPDGGSPLHPERAEVGVRGAEIIADDDGTLGYGDSDTVATAVLPGRWEDAHRSASGTPGFVVRNTAGDDFIERDPAHFYVKVTDPAANLDPGAPDVVFVEVGTLERYPLPAGDPEVIVDAPDVMQAFETGDDTGVFVTQSQLITSNDDDIVEPDDELYTLAPDGGAYMLDDLAGDRTHRIGTRAHGFLAGGVRVTYLGEGSTVPVCGRSPDVRRFVPIRAVALIEPFRDTGIVDLGGSVRSGTAYNGVFDFDNTNTTTDVGGIPVHDPEELSEPYLDISTGAAMPVAGGDLAVTLGRSGRGPVTTAAIVDDQIHRANGAWAPACLEIRRTGNVVSLDAPLNSAGVGVLDDGLIDVDAPNEVHPIFVAMDARLGVGPLTDSTLYFAYGPLHHSHHGGTGGAYGATMIPANFPSLLGRILISMDGYMPRNIRTMAHELGHALSNTGDVPTDPWIFYPSAAARVDDSFQFRRFPEATGELMQTDRPPSDYSAPGNTHRHSY